MGVTVLADPDVDGGDVFAYQCKKTGRFGIWTDKGLRIYGFSTAEEYREKMAALRARGYVFPDSALTKLEAMNL